MKSLSLVYISCLLLNHTSGIYAQDSIKYLSILNPFSIAGNYFRDSADFSGTDGWGGQISGQSLIGKAKIPKLDEMLCTNDSTDFTGFIAIICRGLCDFSSKALVAQKSGATAVIIVNFENSRVVTMSAGSNANQVTIPVFMVTKDIGALIIDALKNNEEVTLSIGSHLEGLGLIQGFVRKDLNGNCTSDSSDNTLGGWIINVKDKSGISYKMKSNNNGFYKGLFSEFFEPYKVSVEPQNTSWTACQPEFEVHVVEEDTSQVDFVVKSNQDCIELHSEISATRLRRCFVSDFYVNVRNEGTIQAKECYVDVELAKEFELISSASTSFKVLRPDLYRFQLGDLNISQDTNIFFQSKVSCDSAKLDQSLCYFAHAYPDTSCLDINSLWNGSNVIIKGLCLGDSVQFTIQNNGAVDMKSLGKYIIIKDDMLYQSSSFKLAVGQIKTINLPADGSTWHLEASQEANHPNPNYPSKTIEACSKDGTFSTGFAMMFQLSDQGFAFDEECQVVVGSFDPNEKEGFPIGFGPSNLIKPNTEIEYVIRFQNTGTDTAFTVVVKDLLPLSLDPNSIHSVVSSHPCEMLINSNNQLVFKFNNINLVDSFTNAPLSHGLVSFKIKQVYNNPIETIIENSAGIYFDFNAPVNTTPTYHKVGEVISIVATKVGEEKKYLSIYPNPASKFINIINETECKLELLSCSGKLIDTYIYKFPKEIKQWDIHGIPSGIYIVRCNDSHSNYLYQKIIIY